MAFINKTLKFFSTQILLARKTWSVNSLLANSRFINKWLYKMHKAFKFDKLNKNKVKNSQPSKSTRLIKGDAQRKQKKSRDTSRANTTDLQHFKKLRFWQNRKEMLNWFNSASRVELNKGHMQGSRGKMKCKSYMKRSCAGVTWTGLCAGGMQVAQGNLY